MSIFIFIVSFSLVTIIVTLLVISAMKYEKYDNSDLRILDLDAAKLSPYDFIVFDNEIHLMFYSNIYDGPCLKTKNFAKIIGADLKFTKEKTDYGIRRKLEWYINDQLIFMNESNCYIILTPTGKNIEYNKNRSFTVNYGQKKLKATLKCAKDNQFILSQKIYKEQFDYDVIDRFEYI